MDGDKTKVKSFLAKSAPQVMGLTVVGSTSNIDQDSMLKLHEGTAGAFGNMVLHPQKKIPAIKHSKCTSGDNVRTVQTRVNDALVETYAAVLYVAPNIVMDEVYPKAFNEQCKATGIRDELYKAVMGDNLNANMKFAGKQCGAPSSGKCAGDVNGDESVNIEDLLTLLGNYGSKGCGASSPPAPPPPAPACKCSDIVLSEIHGGGKPEDYVELYNKGSKACSLKGFTMWDLKTEASPHKYTEIIKAKSYSTCYEDAKGCFTFGLSKKKETIYLGCPGASQGKFTQKLIIDEKNGGKYARGLGPSGKPCNLFDSTPGKANGKCV